MTQLPALFWILQVHRQLHLHGVSCRRITHIKCHYSRSQTGCSRGAINSWVCLWLPSAFRISAPFLVFPPLSVRGHSPSLPPHSFLFLLSHTQTRLPGINGYVFIHWRGEEWISGWWYVEWFCLFRGISLFFQEPRIRVLDRPPLPRLNILLAISLLFTMLKVKLGALCIPGKHSSVSSIPALDWL